MMVERGSRYRDIAMSREPIGQPGRIAMHVAVMVPIVFAPAATSLPAQPRLLFEVVDVDRGSVPAGTPAAFEAPFDAPWGRTDAGRRIAGKTFTFVPLALIPISSTRVALVSTAVNECTSPSAPGARPSTISTMTKESRATPIRRAASGWTGA
ncbi:hypothetical protein ACBY01_15705 [Sphingomonas sp. ac-8]|uniref:hypothetical protein n=1 Tax=Sphingomonas sp. ac-8 TaxID=3242977 RepID=UPI003A805D67